VCVGSFAEVVLEWSGVYVCDCCCVDVCACVLLCTNEGHCGDDSQSCLVGCGYVGVGRCLCFTSRRCVLQGVAAHRSVLQCIAEHGNVWQCTAVCWFFGSGCFDVEQFCFGLFCRLGVGAGVVVGVRFDVWHICMLVAQNSHPLCRLRMPNNMYTREEWKGGGDRSQDCKKNAGYVENRSS